MLLLWRGQTKAPWFARSVARGTFGGWFGEPTKVLKVIENDSLAGDEEFDELLAMQSLGGSAGRVESKKKNTESVAIEFDSER